MRMRLGASAARAARSAAHTRNKPIPNHHHRRMRRSYHMHDPQVDHRAPTPVRVVGASWIRVAHMRSVATQVLTDLSTRLRDTRADAVAGQLITTVVGHHEAPDATATELVLATIRQ